MLLFIFVPTYYGLSFRYFQLFLPLIFGYEFYEGLSINNRTNLNKPPWSAMAASGGKVNPLSSNAVSASHAESFSWELEPDT